MEQIIYMIIGILIFSYVLVYYLWNRYGVKGALVGLLISFCLNLMNLYLDKDVKNKKNKKINNIIGNIFGDTAILVVVMSILALLGSAYTISTRGFKSIGMFLPILITGTFFAAAKIHEIKK